MTPPTTSRPPAFANWLRTAVIVVAVLAIYWPSLHGGWLWDDQKEILRNPELADLASLGRAWVDPQNTTYYPLTTTLFWIELRLWGTNPAGYHFVSIVLHALSALLVWRLLAKLGLRHTWWAGLWFAVHPLAVESVAWIAELKNTASLPLLLLAAWNYLEFDQTGRRRSYVLALAGFVLAMLCKTAVAMLPVVLLLHAWWRRGGIGWADVRRTLPFFAAALALGSATLWFEHHRAIGVWEIPSLTTLERILLTGRALAFYLGKLFVPVELMPVYPQWPASSFSWLDALPWLLLLAGVVWWWRSPRDWMRSAGLGLGFIVLNLAPVLGFVPIAFMRYSWVADHLAYLALVGAAGLLVGVAQWLSGRLQSNFVLPARGLAILACVALAFGARTHAGHFAGPEAFWGFALQRNPNAWVAHANLAQRCTDQSDFSGAIDHYQAAVRVAPQVDSLHFNLGTALLQTGRAADALAEFETVAQLKPDAVDAAINAASAELQLQRFAAARSRLEKLLARTPGLIDARLLLGDIYEAENRPDEAAREYSKALADRPGSIPARLKLANAQFALGNLQTAAQHYENVIRADPENVEAFANLGALRMQSGERANALRCFETAARLDPRNASVLVNLATALAAEGRFREALARVDAALRVDANSAPARELRAQLLQEPALRR